MAIETKRHALLRAEAKGTTLATGQPISLGLTLVEHDRDGADSGVVLPPAVTDASATVWNLTGATIKVYPRAGDQIDALGAGNAYSLVTGHLATFRASSGTQWASQLGDAA